MMPHVCAGVCVARGRGGAPARAPRYRYRAARTGARHGGAAALYFINLRLSEYPAQYFLDFTQCQSRSIVLRLL